MPRQASYPIISKKNWVKLRELFRANVPSLVDEKYINANLGISLGTAQTLTLRLRDIGLIDENGNVTQRGIDWRYDERYRRVCSEIRQEAYPQKLLEAIPGPRVNHEKATQWFVTNAGVTQKTAKRMAVFYALITEANILPADTTRHYDLSKIRTVLTEGFTAGELRHFCHDTSEFRELYHQLPPTIAQTEAAQKIIEYAQHRELIEDLLNFVKEKNPRRYERHQPYW